MIFIKTSHRNGRQLPVDSKPPHRLDLSFRPVILQQPIHNAPPYFLERPPPHTKSFLQNPTKISAFHPGESLQLH